MSRRPRPDEPPENARAVKRRREYEGDTEGLYQRLWQGLPPAAAEKLNNAILHGELGEREIDVSVLDSLSQFPPHTIDEIIDAFLRGWNDGGLGSVRSKSAWLAGILKRFRQSGKGTSKPLSHDRQMPSSDPRGTKRFGVGGTLRSRNVKDALQELISMGILKPDDFDGRVYDLLYSVREAAALAVLNELTVIDVRTIRKIGGWAVSTLRLVAGQGDLYDRPPPPRHQYPPRRPSQFSLPPSADFQQGHVEPSSWPAQQAPHPGNGMPPSGFDMTGQHQPHQPFRPNPGPQLMEPQRLPPPAFAMNDRQPNLGVGSLDPGIQQPYPSQMTNNYANVVGSQQVAISAPVPPSQHQQVGALPQQLPVGGPNSGIQQPGHLPHGPQMQVPTFHDQHQAPPPSVTMPLPGQNPLGQGVISQGGAYDPSEALNQPTGTLQTTQDISAALNALQGVLQSGLLPAASPQQQIATNTYGNSNAMAMQGGLGPGPLGPPSGPPQTSNFPPQLALNPAPPPQPGVQVNPTLDVPSHPPPMSQPMMFPNTGLRQPELYQPQQVSHSQGGRYAPDQRGPRDMSRASDVYPRMGPGHGDGPPGYRERSNFSPPHRPFPPLPPRRGVSDPFVDKLPPPCRDYLDRIFDRGYLNPEQLDEKAKYTISNLLEEQGVDVTCKALAEFETSLAQDRHNKIRNPGGYFNGIAKKFLRNDRAQDYGRDRAAPNQYRDRIDSRPR